MGKRYLQILSTVKKARAPKRSAGFGFSF
jgi:hypothetical protein